MEAMVRSLPSAYLAVKTIPLIGRPSCTAIGQR